MQFDNKNKWYEQLIPDERVHSYLIGRQADAQTLLQLPTLRNFPLVRMQQVHGNTIAVVDQSPSQPITTLAQTDAVLTRLPHVLLEVRVADCLPMVLWHKSGLVGVVHAGRVGTQLGILQKTLLFMRDSLHISRDVVVWFGPAICAQHYQVNRETNAHFDLIGENKQQLSKVFGQGTFTLIESELCTVSDNELFYSYRHEGTGERNKVLVSFSDMPQ